MKKKIALAGNPNVGKSTIFNALTGMHQHTGNWPGKTVSQAIGEFQYRGIEYELIDLPGTYSLISHSEEETVTRNFLCFEEYDAVIVVCDGLCLERNLNLVLQILEITPNVVVCINLLDEARKKKVTIHLDLLEKKLGVPVVGTEARKKKGIDCLLEKLHLLESEHKKTTKVRYPRKVEEKVIELEAILKKKEITDLPLRWLALRLIEKDIVLEKEIINHWKISLSEDPDINKVLETDNDIEKDIFASAIMQKAEQLTMEVVSYQNPDYEKRSRKIDKILTSKRTGIPLMLLMLMFIFWLTITGANYPSQLLFDFFSYIEGYLVHFLEFISCPSWLNSLLVGGIYKTLS